MFLLVYLSSGVDGNLLPFSIQTIPRTARFLNYTLTIRSAALFIFLTRGLRGLKRTTKMIVLSNIIYIFQYRTNPRTVAIKVVEGKAGTLIPNFYLVRFEVLFC